MNTRNLKPASLGRLPTQKPKVLPAILTAVGQDPTQQTQTILRQSSTVRLGRSVDCELAIPWDRSISRFHADLRWEGAELHVTCLTDARNPLVYQDETVREAIVFSGERFRIGHTVFFVNEHDERQNVEATGEQTSTTSRNTITPEERAYSASDLKHVPFHNAKLQLELLSQLPALISETDSDADLGQALCGLLMNAIPQAVAVAVAFYDVEELPDEGESTAEFPRPKMMRVQTRDHQVTGFRPSRSIIVKTLRQQAGVSHVWHPEVTESGFTVSEGLGWAVCAPIRDASCEGWCMYVSGKGTRDGGLFVSETDLAADLRFTELVAQFIGSVRHVRLLQMHKSKLDSFFSPKVIDGLNASNETNALEPAERNITVLFCDVRGFSRKAEGQADDLLALLKSVRAALGIMVDGILERDGAVADFQGDAALGFWGWPVALKYGPIAACRAAIEIHNRFRQSVNDTASLLEGFSVGIGIAHGRAVAGQIGTDRQSKIGVFGPVVNQCSRLEGMTKHFGVSICVDAATAEFLERYLPQTEARLRKLAKVRPHGMDSAIEVFNLLPPEDAFPEVTSEMIHNYENALTAFTKGHWETADEFLCHLPKDDGPTSFLRRQMLEFNNTPPTDWDGIVSLDTK